MPHSIDEFYFGDEECKKALSMSLSDLESAVFEITKKQNYISNC